MAGPSASTQASRRSSQPAVAVRAFSGAIFVAALHRGSRQAVHALVTLSARHVLRTAHSFLSGGE